MTDKLTGARPVPGALDVKHSACTGCRLCEMACSVAHENSVFPRASRIQVAQFGAGPIDVPVVCHRCSDHPCVASCPPKIRALSVDPEMGTVRIDNSLCLGVKCGKCAKACTHHTAVFFHPKTRKPLFCDLCSGAPECAKVCPAGVLSYMPGSAFDGRHYAKSSPADIARGISLRFLPSRGARK